VTTASDEAALTQVKLEDEGGDVFFGYERERDAAGHSIEHLNAARRVCEACSACDEERGDVRSRELIVAAAHSPLSRGGMSF
jgi:hypothetical protein